MSTSHFDKKDIRLILSLFAGWRLLLFGVLFLAARLVPLQKNFLGGGIANYLTHPYLFAWANFDGEHYMSIATYGYKSLQHAFFPVYPILIRLFASPFSLNFATLASAGFLISNLAFIGSLIILWKLLLLDYPRKIALLTTLLLLVFPTSFYLGAVYNESLYLFLSLAAFYAVRRDKWILGGILGMVASGTRVFGILLLPAFLIEAWQAKIPIKKCFWTLLIPLGLTSYMFYQAYAFQDPLAFVHSLSSFGEQRSQTAILLPQVFYRYIFKILPNLNYSYFPVTFSALLEFVVGIGFLIASVVSFFKLRLSYAVYLSLGYLLPTLTGSFSSLPRYVLVLFPFFILSSIWLNKAPRILQISVLGLLFVLLTISTCLFLRGYWIS